MFITAFPQALSTLFNGQQIKNEQIDEIPDCYHLLENASFNPPRIDHSSLLTFATALNLCYHRNLLQLTKHCQSIVMHILKLFFISIRFFPGYFE